MPKPLDPNTPVYLVPATDPTVIYLINELSMFAAADMHTMIFKIKPEMVEQGIVSHIQEFIFAVQHFPELISKYVFSCEFQFEQIADSELLFSEDEWKDDPVYYRWFQRLSFPPILFFIRDPDCRYYFLIGDWLADGILESDIVKGKSAVRFNELQLQQMALRVFECCRLFKLYCHGTGFNPDPYIEGIIAEFKMDGSNLLEEVQKQYREDVEQGLHIRVKPL